MLPEAIIPVAPLPGDTKQLHHPVNALRSEGRIRKRWRLTCVSFFIWTFAAMLMFFAVWLAAVFNHTPSATSSFTLENFVAGYDLSGNFNCNAWTTSNWAQTYFMIDIFNFQGLEFWHAKMIDAAWDLVVGQFGRFVHGWILWRYVVSPGMTLLMESSAMPYNAIVNLSFSTVSLFTVRDTFKSIQGQHKLRPKAIQWWFVYAILYTLAFPTLWGATTGYINPTITVFRAPDGNYLYPLSNSLQLCYSLDTERLGPNVSQIVLGPTLLELSQQHRNIAKAEKGGLPGPAPVNVSDNFRDILHYVLTQRLVEYAITTRWEPNATTTSFNFTAANQIPRLSGEFPGLPADLIGHRLCGHDEPGCSNSTKAFPWGVISSKLPYASSSWRGNVWTVSDAFFDIHPSNVSMPLTTTTMTLSDASRVTGGSSRWIRNWPPNKVVPRYGDPLDTWLTSTAAFPYNSSLWYEGQLHSLPAPFLDVSKDCVPTTYSAPACLCYAGKPLNYKFVTVDSESMGCLSESSDYSWGFGSVITATALAAEFIWVIGCWSVWLDAERRSVLINHRRSAAGDIRKILDIAASINHDLGTETVANSEVELKKALRECDMIGHEMHEDEEVKGTVGVLTRRHQGRVLEKRRAKEKEKQPTLSTVTTQDLGSLEKL